MIVGSASLNLHSVVGHSVVGIRFWLYASTAFDNWHFSGRRTHAMEVLEAKNKVALVDVFHVLLKLFGFFDRLASHDFKGATSIIDGMFLLPRSSEELLSKASNCKLMNPVLKNAFPAIIEGAMDSLYHQFVRIKFSGIMPDGTTLQELKKRASLLMSFAFALELPLNVRSRMTDMEAQMI